MFSAGLALLFMKAWIPQGKKSDNLTTYVLPLLSHHIELLPTGHLTEGFSTIQARSWVNMQDVEVAPNADL